MRGSAVTAAALLTAGQAAADLLYVSHYAGQVQTLNLTASAGSDHPPAMANVATSTGCGESPSWLTLDHANAVLYCVNEGFTSGGSLSALRTNSDGSLTTLNKAGTSAGPVSAVLFGNKGLAMAHYGNGFSTWNVANPSSIKNVEFLTYTGSGPDKDRQDGPHPHEAVLDPTKKFLLVPDLGTDEVHVYTFDANSLKTTAQTALKAPAGSGPRHIAFAQKGGKTFMYLITELTSNIIGYEVTYSNGIQFKQIFAHGVHGKDKPNTKGAYAAEIVVSSDNKFLIASSRGDNNFKIPSFNSTGTITSDPLINYSINADGTLTVLQEVACGGSYPRQFSLNKAGTRVAVGLQKDDTVAVIERDPNSGKLGKFVAYAKVGGDVTSVIFNE